MSHYRIIKYLFLLFITIQSTTQNFYDIKGTYCGTRYDPCCELRKDSCSVPIEGTLCYCDEFCDREINSDCCPDYRDICKPNQVQSCYYEGHYIKYNGLPVQINCNLCHCMRNNEVICEIDICLSEPNMIDSINRNSHIFGWRAQNYTQHWNHKFNKALTQRLGTIKPNFIILPIRHKNEILENYFNAFNKWPGLISDIRDQEWCSSSWAFSTISVLSDRFAIQSKGKENITLSPQQLISCTKNNGCDGGNLDIAWNYLRKFGMVEDQCYPYQGEKGYCSVQLNDNLETLNCNLPRKVPRKELYKSGPAYALRTVKDIMIEIKHYGPVQATMKVYHDFFSYRDGIYRHTPLSKSNEYGYHSVRIVGWGEEYIQNRLVKYWIVANSWGKWWGENGFFRIIRGNNECDIEKYVLASWARDYYHNNHKNI